jgi:predicted DCC family thiol-disulfide oxidoreductase YuxK
MQAVLIYDGSCNLCNGTVRFVKRHDKHSRFSFITGQSDEGKKLIEEYLPGGSDIDTVILIDEGKCYLRSKAALTTMKLLGGGWSIIYIFMIIPAPVRDLVYRFIAGNRHRWCGRND